MSQKPAFSWSGNFGGVIAGFGSGYSLLPKKNASWHFGEVFMVVQGVFYRHPLLSLTQKKAGEMYHEVHPPDFIPFGLR